MKLLMDFMIVLGTRLMVRHRLLVDTRQAEGDGLLVDSRLLFMGTRLGKTTEMP